GRVAQAGALAVPPPAPDDAALDRRRALGLDQLLADRPGQRLERLRAAPNAEVRAGANAAPEQRVEAEPLVEGPQVVVDRQSEAHPGDGLLGGRAVPGRGGEQDAL